MANESLPPVPKNVNPTDLPDPALLDPTGRAITAVCLLHDGGRFPSVTAMGVALMTELRRRGLTIVRIEP